MRGRNLYMTLDVVNYWTPVVGYLDLRLRGEELRRLLGDLLRLLPDERLLRLDLLLDRDLQMNKRTRYCRVKTRSFPRKEEILHLLN